MKLLVIGHSVVDHILRGEDELIQTGGLYYSALAFNAMMNKNDNVFLITSTDSENEKLFNPVYNKFDIRWLNHIERLSSVRLTIHDSGERSEVYDFVTPNLTLPKYNFDQFDGIYVNMVTGTDITPDQIIELRKSTDKLIYIDIHTLSRGIDENKRRFFRKIPDAEKWISACDIIQANETELYTLTDQTDELNAAKNIILDSEKILIVTKAERGARIYFRMNNEYVSVFISSLKVNTKNRIGCGDVFGAAFFYNYIESGNILTAARFATIAAGIAASYNSINDFSGFGDDLLARHT